DPASVPRTLPPPQLPGRWRSTPPARRPNLQPELPSMVNLTASPAEAVIRRLEGHYAAYLDAVCAITADAGSAGDATDRRAWRLAHARRQARRDLDREANAAIEPLERGAADMLGGSFDNFGNSSGACQARSRGRGHVAETIAAIRAEQARLLR